MRGFFLGAGLAAVLMATGAEAADPTVERGDYLVNAIGGCGNCHTPLSPEGSYIAGQALAGRLVEITEQWTAVAPNITPAGRVSAWSDEELARSIREGIRPDGSIIGPPMPFEVYRGISDTDLQSVVMFLRTVVPVESDPGVSEYHVPLPPAWGPPIASVAEVPQAVSVGYGAYLAGPVGHCIVCHTPFGETGPQFETMLGAGGNPFPGPWGVSVSTNITPTGLSGYTDAEIITMITQGARPDGTPMFPPMPYPLYARITGDDLEAIVLYLRSLEPRPTP